MNYELIEGHGIRAKVYVSDMYLSLNQKKSSKLSKNNANTSRKGITSKILKKRPKYPKVIRIRLRNGKNT